MDSMLRGLWPFRKSYTDMDVSPWSGYAICFSALSKTKNLVVILPLTTPLVHSGKLTHSNWLLLPCTKRTCFLGLREYSFTLEKDSSFHVPRSYTYK